MLYKEEIVFALTKEVSYQDESGDHMASELILKAPTGKQEKATAVLQQKLMKAAMTCNKLMNIEADESTESPNAGDEPSLEAQCAYILTALKVSSDDYFDYKCCLYRMLSNGLGFIEGSTSKVKLTQTIIDEISLKDKDRLVGEYTANFIMP